MKYILPMFKFSFDKIINGTKRIDIRLYEDEYQKIKLNDIIEYVCDGNNESLHCLVRGIVVFERFDDLIDLFSPKMFGFDNREEIKIRVRRLYSFEDQLAKHVVGFIFMPLQLEEQYLEKHDGDEYLPKERNAGQDLKASVQKNFSEINQLKELEPVWKPIGQGEICSDLLDESEQISEMVRIKTREGRQND